MTDKAIKIWCDGSFRYAEKTAGAGWVIKLSDPDETFEGSIALPPLRDSFKYSSEIAEISSFYHALSQIATGVDEPVIVHMDCESVIQSLNTGSLNRKIRNQAQNYPTIANIFQKARALKRAQPDLTLVRSRQNWAPEMMRADVLSKSASDPENWQNEMARRTRAEPREQSALAL